MKRSEAIKESALKLSSKVYLGFPVPARFLRLISPLSVEQLQASIFLHSLYVETKSVQEEITKTCTKYLCQTLPAISRFRFTKQPVTWWWILYVSPYWKPFWIFVCAARGTREWSPALPQIDPEMTWPRMIPFLARRWPWNDPQGIPRTSSLWADSGKNFGGACTQNKQNAYY